MTIADLSKLSDEKLCHRLHFLRGLCPQGVAVIVPNYTTDLNAVAAVEAGLKEKAHPSATTDMERAYRDNLAKVIGCAWYQSAKLIFASARQRAIALIATLTP